MKVLMLNGSPHTNGNTALALGQLEAIFDVPNWVNVYLMISSTKLPPNSNGRTD